MFLGVGAGALYLRLRLHSASHQRALAGEGRRQRTRELAQRYIDQALEAQSPQASNPIQPISPPLLLQGQATVRQDSTSSLYLSTSSSITPTSLPGQEYVRRLYDEPIVSCALGLLFFLLSMAALIIGLSDYLRTERALEKADMTLEEMEERERVEGDLAGNTGARIDAAEMGRAMDVKQASHDVRWALEAHLSRIVRVYEVIMCLVISAVAFFFLIAGGDDPTVAPTG